MLKLYCVSIQDEGRVVFRNVLAENHDEAIHMVIGDLPAKHGYTLDAELVKCHYNRNA